MNVDIYPTRLAALRCPSSSNRPRTTRWRGFGTHESKRGETEILLFLASLHKEQPGNSHEILEWLVNALTIAEEIKEISIMRERVRLFFSSRNRYNPNAVFVYPCKDKNVPTRQCHCLFAAQKSSRSSNHET